MPTAEIYRINENGTRTYAGYARFGANGEYLGSRGGYGSRQNARNGNGGRGTTNMGERPFNGGLRNQGNSRSNRASMLQNAINSAAARNAARRRR